MAIPHADRTTLSIPCAVITVSDTRTGETDRSGQAIQALLRAAGHRIVFYTVVPDEPGSVASHVVALAARPDVAVILLNGGTGIAPRDTTYDAIAHRLEKTLPGFGELFRGLSYQEIGSRAMASRAIAGTLGSTLIFSMPGSTPAVTLAMEKLILPELQHLVGQLGRMEGAI
jgi:molybdopterin adenylyltransferase